MGNKTNNKIKYNLDIKQDLNNTFYDEKNDFNEKNLREENEGNNFYLNKNNQSLFQDKDLIPKSYNPPFESKELNIPKLKDAIILNNEIIKNVEDEIFCKKFDKLNLFDNDYKKNIEKIKEKKIIKNMNIKECLTIISYYIKENKIEIGISNGDIQKASKRYNDLIKNN